MEVWTRNSFSKYPSSYSSIAVIITILSMLVTKQQCWRHHSFKQIPYYRVANVGISNSLLRFFSTQETWKFPLAYFLGHHVLQWWNMNSVSKKWFWKKMTYQKFYSFANCSNGFPKKILEIFSNFIIGKKSVYVWVEKVGFLKFSILSWVNEWGTGFIANFFFLNFTS